MKLPLPVRLSALFLLSACTALHAAPIDLASPDGTLHLTLNTDTAGHLQYRLTRDANDLLLPAPLGITVDGKDLGAGATLGQPARANTDATYPWHGAHATAINRSNDLTLPITTDGISWTLEARLFNDAVAFRYRVPAASSTATRKITGEATEFSLPPGGRIWYQTHNARKDYENPFQESTLDQLKTGAPIAAPATIKLAGDLGYVMLTEANLVDYSDMALQHPDANRFTAFFHNTPKGWDWQGDIASPWRVAIIARDLTTLVNTDALRNLCPAPAPELLNAAWIQPGRSTWHWMVTGRPTLADQPKWIDWTSALGYEYYIIDDGWKRWRAEGKDEWACLKDVVDYAKTKNVKIYAWVNCNEITPAARKAYFEKAAALGIVGLKIDFMKPADAVWVNWYDDTLREAAAARLMVDFHGALKPTGRERTWPNELTREAVKGREGGKLPGLHDTAIPFTRFVQGPADYTPTDFRPEKLKTSTWSRELAQAIVYTSPLLCLSGAPETYLANPAVDILKSLPPTWDETRVLPGSEIGQTAAFARRKGKDWYIGVINGAAANQITLDLNFLPPNTTYTFEQFADAPEKNDAYTQSKTPATSKTTLPLTLRPDGGFVGKLKQQTP